MCSGIYGPSAEDRHFEGMLNRHLDKEAEGERRAEWIEERVPVLTAKDGDFYPFKPEHFGEALGEIDGEHLKSLADDASDAHDLPGNDLAAHIYANALNNLVQCYWERMARSHAETEYDTSGEP